MIEPFSEKELKPNPFNVKNADKYVWCVFHIDIVKGNAEDYEFLAGIYDSEEKARAYMEELEKINQSKYIYFVVEKVMVK